MRVLKNVNVELCGMKKITLTKESIQTLGVHISYNKKIQNDLKFSKTIKNLCNVIKFWHIRKLTLKSKIISIFKNCALSDNNKSSKYCN